MIHSARSFKEMRPAGFDGLFDWDFMKPAFAPTKIEPMDLDCIIERHGNFLVFETKAPGQLVPKGQQITLNALVRTGCFTVAILKVKRVHHVRDWIVWRTDRDGEPELEACKGDGDALLGWVRAWFVSANERRRRVPRKILVDQEPTPQERRIAIETMVSDAYLDYYSEEKAEARFWANKARLELEKGEADVCFSCRGTRFWRRGDGPLVCGTCHPPATPEGIEWHE